MEEQGTPIVLQEEVRNHRNHNISDPLDSLLHVNQSYDHNITTVLHETANKMAPISKPARNVRKWNQ